MAIKILGVIRCFGGVAEPKTRLRPLLVSETSKQVKVNRQTMVEVLQLDRVEMNQNILV